MRKETLRASILVSACLLGVTAYATPIFESSFEGGPPIPASPGFLTCESWASQSDPCRDSLYSYSAFTSDWIVTDGSVDWVESLWQAGSGSRSIDMDGFQGRGTIRTKDALNTEAGAIYLVTFDMSGNPGMPNLPAFYDPLKQLEVSAADETVYFKFDAGGLFNTFQDMKWVQMAFTFVASGNDYLTFRSMTPDNSNPFAYSWGAALDDVSVVLLELPPPPPPITEIPEPGTSLSLLGGLALLAFNRRRRAN